MRYLGPAALGRQKSDRVAVSFLVHSCDNVVARTELSMNSLLNFGAISVFYEMPSPNVFRTTSRKIAAEGANT